MTRHLSPKHGALAVALALAAMATPPAFAVNKDMVELQTQIQGLQDAVARLQQSNDERMGVMKDLVQQSADTINKMTVTVDGLQRLIRTQQEATGGKIDQVSGQVTALSDSVDEIKVRMSKLEKTLKDLQDQQQSINATLQNMNPAAGATPAGSSLPSTGATQAPVFSAPPPTTQPAPVINKRGKPSAGVPMAAVTVPEAAPAPMPTAPPAADLYKTALSDYMAAKYPLASSEFADVNRLYPDDPLSGNAYYYQGEIDYRAGKFAQAVKDYDRVLEQFPDNPKVPVSHLHKGMALFALKQNDAGIREMRTLIARFPSSTEATQARSKLNGLGVPAVSRR